METGFQIGVASRRGVPSGAVAQPAVWLIAGTNGRVGDGSYTVSASTGATEIKDRTPHILGFACGSIRISLHNWFASTSGEQSPTGTVDIAKAAIEWQGTGIAALRFAGERTAQLSPNAFELLADSLRPADFGSPLAAFPRDAIFYVTLIYGAAAGTTVATGVPCKMTAATSPAPSGICRVWVYAPANRIDDVDSAGGKATPTGAIEPSGFALPRFLLGIAAEANPRSVLAIGDSISVGLNSPTNPCARITGFGLFDHAALHPATHDGAIAIGHSGRQGETLATWMQSNARRRQLLARCTIAVLQHGTNDIALGGTGPSTAFDGTNKGSPLANLQFTFAAFHALARTMPQLRRIYQTSLLPRATGTSDSYRSAAGQTIQPGWAAGGLRDQLEAWWVSCVASGAIDGVIDIRPGVSDPADNHFWLTDGSTANLMTSDGVHPLAAGHAAAAGPIRSALLAAF